MLSSNLILTCLAAVVVAAPQKNSALGAKTTPPHAAHIESTFSSGGIKPGPGMPSLASLGVTTAQLASPNFKKPNASPNVNQPSTIFGKQADQQCYYDDGYTASRSAAIACRNYLLTVASGSTCSTGQTKQLLVSYQDAELVAWNQYNVAGGVTTSCDDAAVAASWVIDNCSPCTQDSCQVEGQAPGQSNPNFFAYIGHV